MARRLSLPIRTWYNYESGVTVPAEVMLRFVELTNVEPLWLLHGKGPKFRLQQVAAMVGDSVEALLRSALLKLEGSASPCSSSNGISLELPSTDSPDVVLIHVDGSDQVRLTNESGPRFLAARREWLAARRDCRCVRIDGDAMAPIVADGAYVAYSEDDCGTDQLDGNLVVAWIDGETVVRWFDKSGRYGVLRAENPAHEPSSILIDMEAPEGDHLVRKVLWISTPH